MAVLDSCPRLHGSVSGGTSEGMPSLWTLLSPKNHNVRTLPSKVAGYKHWHERDLPKNKGCHKESVSKQGRKFAKGESLVQGNPLFDEIPEDTVDHMETENAQDVGRTREIVDEEKEIDENILSTEDVLSTDKEKVSTDRPIVSTDGSKVSTDRQIEGTDEQIKSTKEQIESTDGQRKGTEDHTEEGSATQATQTPTSIIFGDDEIISYQVEDTEGLIEFFGEMVHTLVTETGYIHSYALEKKYPLRKKVLVQMLKLKLESEEDSTMALKLIRFIKKLLAELEPEE
ncbi:hypothetical protein Tco_0369532 [Tanacetum coccineum]